MFILRLLLTELFCIIYLLLFYNVNILFICYLNRVNYNFCNLYEWKYTSYYFFKYLVIDCV